MSGGSYNYLFIKDADDLFDAESDLRAMADRLAGLGYAEDAAAETEELILMLRQARVRLNTRAQRLRDVWHAVEWCDSGDSGEDGVVAALESYRHGN